MFQRGIQLPSIEKYKCPIYEFTKGFTFSRKPVFIYWQKYVILDYHSFKNCTCKFKLRNIIYIQYSITVIIFSSYSYLVHISSSCSFLLIKFPLASFVHYSNGFFSFFHIQVDYWLFFVMHSFNVPHFRSYLCIYICSSNFILLKYNIHTWNWACNLTS